MTRSSPAPGRVLVTGAAGAIGRATVDLLVSRGVAVTALSLEYHQDLPADRVLVGDARDPDDVAAALDGADALVHLAAKIHPTAGTPLEVYTTNVTSTFNVLAEAGRRGVPRAVIASSINAFGVPLNGGDVMPAYFPIDERIPADVADPYSLSKQSDELTATMAWRTWGIDVVALRFPLVRTHEGLRESRDAQRRDPRAGVREGWAYLDVRDAARAVEHALTARLTGAHVVGLAADDTLLDVPTTRLVAEYAPDVPLTREIADTDPLVDTSVARALLGFTPRYSVHDPAPVARPTAQREGAATP